MRLRSLRRPTKAAIRAAAEDAATRAIVMMGAGQTFIAGADIREFGKIASGEAPPLDFLPFLLAIEDSSKPVIMAIHGTAFGAGLPPDVLPAVAANARDAGAVRDDAGPCAREVGRHPAPR